MICLTLSGHLRSRAVFITIFHCLIEDLSWNNTAANQWIGCLSPKTYHPAIRTAWIDKMHTKIELLRCRKPVEKQAH